MRTQSTKRPRPGLESLEGRAGRVGDRAGGRFSPPRLSTLPNLASNNKETAVQNPLLARRRARTTPRRRVRLSLESLESRALLTNVIATTTTFGYASNQAHGVGIQPDGKVVVAGTADITSFYESGNNRLGVARYNADLTPDTSFGSGGTQTTAPVSGSSNDAVAMSIDSTSTANNGKVVLAGAVPSKVKGLYYWDFAIARYTAAGALDTSFGGGKGFVTANIAGTSKTPYDFAASVAIDGTQGANYDKIVAAGFASNGSYNEVALARFTPSGALDTTFNSHGSVPGSVELDLGISAYAASIVVDAQGDYIVGGNLGTWQTNSMPGWFGNGPSGTFLARFTPNGALDPTFGNGGEIVTTSSSSLNGLALDASGNIVVVGQVNNPLASGYAERFTPNGSLDPTFGNGGVVQFPQTPEFFISATAVAIQPGTGSVIVVGKNRTATGGFTIARLNPDGTLDTTFNGTGTLTYVFPTDGGAGDGNAEVPSGVALSPSGNIVAVGWASTGVNQTAWDVLSVQPSSSPASSQPATALSQTTILNQGLATLTFDSPDPWDALHPLTRRPGTHYPTSMLK
jgi:uncharacterized delta-60 repeat protein